MDNLTNDELLKLASASFEAHESVKARIVELTFQIEQEISTLNEIEATWVQTVEELKRRNDVRKEIPSEI